MDPRPAAARAPPTSGIDREASNVALLRDQLRELENDVANGTCRRALRPGAARARAAGARGVEGGGSGRRCAIARRRVDGRDRRRAGADRRASSSTCCSATPTRSRRRRARPRQSRRREHDITPAQVEEMVTKLAAKLEKEPANVEGWVVLARTYYYAAALPRGGAARSRRAVALAPDDAGPARRLRRHARRRAGRHARRQAAGAHRARAQDRPDALEGARARRHRRVQSQGLPPGGRLLGAVEADGAARVGHRTLDRRQHRGGAGARATCRPGRPRRRDPRSRWRRHRRHAPPPRPALRPLPRQRRRCRAPRSPAR